MTAKPSKTPRDAAVEIIKKLRYAGHTAYLAGGCVRDALLGLEPKDYDVATDAHPEAVRKLLPRSRYVGESFGVVLAVLGGQRIEVATFRKEWGYEDGRRPSEIIFTNAEEDARRRDFTINGLFADPLERDPLANHDRIIDYVGGMSDLNARLIRAVGDPDQRFAEDYLRMIRAVRFAARLGFEIEPKTAASIRPLAKYLGQISRERIGQELQWILTGPHAGRAALLIQSLRLDSPVLNEDHQNNALKTIESLESKGGYVPYSTMLAAWMIDRHVPSGSIADVAALAGGHARQTIRKWRKALSLSNELRDELQRLFALLAKASQWHSLRIAARKRLLADAMWHQVMQVLHALPEPEFTQKITHDSEPLFLEGVAPYPLVDGSDLINMGLEPGPVFRRLLDGVYDAQLEGEVRDQTEALVWIKANITDLT